MSYYNYHSEPWPGKRTIYSKSMAQTFNQNRTLPYYGNTVQLFYDHLSKDKETYAPVNVNYGWEERIPDYTNHGWQGKDERIEKINERLNSVIAWIGQDERIAKINERVTNINDRINSMNYEWKGKDERVDKIDKRLDKIDKRLDKINQHINSITGVAV
tara:strand:- start:2934 stop:3410 length:477 start_codon:yes stop_codon:yes gene_type:complete